MNFTDFMRKVVAAALMLALVTGVTHAAGQREVVRLSDPQTVGQPGAITGTALRQDGTPITHSSLRLRDVKSGDVVRRTEADELGRFTFLRVPAGSYAVELVDDRDRVLAIGQAFNLAPAETVTTLIRLGAIVPWFTGFFGNAAAAALAAAASLGVTAIGEGGQPASPRS